MSNSIAMKVWGLQAPFAENSCDPAAVATAISSAACREGVILHHCDVVGISHSLGGSGMEQKITEAFHEQSGVSPTVIVYGQQNNDSHSLAGLCELVGRHSGDRSNIVVIQGAYA